MSPECLNCIGVARDECDRLYKKAAAQIVGWAGTLEPFLERTDGFKLDSSKSMREFAIDRLSLPLHEINCGVWDDNDIINAKITQAIGEM